MSPRDFARTALSELEVVVNLLDDAEIRAACERIFAARRIMVYGCGREGLMMRALAMRLHHLGLSVSVQGDMTAPPLSCGDLFVASAGPGELSTVNALIDAAVDAGAAILFLTAVPDTPASARSSLVLQIPAQTHANENAAASVLPMGSLYEGTIFILFEAMVNELTELCPKVGDGHHHAAA